MTNAPAPQETSYEPLKRQIQRFESEDTPDLETPKDHNGVLYIVLVVVGIGFALPYNSFILASDYWIARFVGHAVQVDMSMTYLTIALATAFLNNLFLSKLSLKMRFIFGYLLSLLTLVIFIICELVWHVFDAIASYSATVVLAALMAVGCTIQQTTFYGFASMFPKKYVQAVMLGESLAALFIAFVRIPTKIFTDNTQILPIFFLTASIVCILFSCCKLFLATIHSPFVRFHINACSKSTPRPEGNIVLSNNNRRFEHFRYCSKSEMTKAIFPCMVSIALVYCVTVSLYPGIESEIVSCNLKSWMPVLLMFIFNISDVFGKVLSLIPYNWSQRQLILLSILRISIMPLLILCCAPRSQPVIFGEIPVFIFTAALGITNGLGGSLSMMVAPTKVPAALTEPTGYAMTLAYNIGLNAGLWLSFVFDSVLGAPIERPCPTFPFVATDAPLNITMSAFASIPNTK